MMISNKVQSQLYTLFLKDYNLLKLIFLGVAFFLILKALYIYMIVKPTYTSNIKRNLGPEDFPEIILCPDQPIDLDAAKSRGYRGMYDYFLGRRGWDYKHIGWIGNKSEDVKLVSLNISSLKSVDDCPPTGHHFFSHSKFINNKSTKSELIYFNQTKVLYPNHICCKVNPPELSKSYPLKQINLVLNKSQGFSVFMADKLTASYFNLHQATMIGDKIVSGKTGEYFSYKVQILEDEKLEDDANYQCIDYKMAGEYAACIENEIVKKTLKFLNCTPPWMTDNEDVWCRGINTLETQSESESYYTFLEDLSVSGEQVEECSVPCKTKTFHVTQIDVDKEDREWKGIYLYFEKNVKISKASFNMDLETMYSTIGGIMGTSRSFVWLIVLLMSAGGLLLARCNVNVVSSLINWCTLSTI